MLMTAAVHMDSSSSSTTTTTSPGAGPSLPARRTAKRRPRRPPSRRLPSTTYINADPASFRRMVHQATGADDVLPQPDNAETVLARPAPVRADGGGGGFTAPGGAPLLPTLDTSAFLVGASSRSRTGAGAPLSRNDGSATAAPSALELEARDYLGRACNNNNNTGGGGGGFPTLESWDHHALF